MGVRAIPSIICSSTLSRSVYERSNVRVLDLREYINHTKWIKEKEAVIDELRRAFELAQQQDEAMQRYIAEIIMQELTEDEIEVSLELAEELKTAHEQIVAGDVRDYEVFQRERWERERT